MISSKYICYYFYNIWDNDERTEMLLSMLIITSVMESIKFIHGDVHKKNVLINYYNVPITVKISSVKTLTHTFSNAFYSLTTNPIKLYIIIID